jgi:hypothetical protein
MYTHKPETGADFGNLANMVRGSVNGSEVLTAGDFGPSGTLFDTFFFPASITEEQVQIL